MQDENLASEDQGVDLTSNDFTHGDEDTAQADETVTQEDAATSEEPGEKSEEDETEGTAVEVQATESDEPEPDEDDSTAKPATGAQKRIGKLTFEKRQAERENQTLREQLEQMQQQAPTAPAQSHALTPPTLESTGYDEELYQRSMSEWATGNTQQQMKAQQEAQTQKTRFEEFTQKSEQFADANEDYFEKISDQQLPISELMADAIYESDKGPQILYYLANNHERASAIASMSPGKAALEIGRLEARFSLPAANTKKTTTAPPAVRKVVGGAGTSAQDPDSQYAFIGGATFD